MNEFAVAELLPNAPLKSIDDLLEKVKKYYPEAPLSRIEKAYHFSEKAHAGQIRRSGEPYISHPLCVAGILADLRLDVDTIITGLLHDTVEDTAVTLDDIRKEFGDAVATLVDGVTKISKLNFKTSLQQQGENIRKMIVAMGKDVRVILVKLADRLHNMRTLHHMPYEKQARIALETLEIYAPLAGRLGLSNIKVELEDLSFRFYMPDIFYELQQKVEAHEKDQAKFIEEVKKILSEELKKAGLDHFVLQGRSKHLWSIYRKMKARNLDYSQIYDVMAFRVIVDNVSQCYSVLGLVHSLWKPIPGRFKDFIAMPKANGYQSLHTTVIGPNGQRIEIQIRTFDMHQVAEKGIAAHWKYKERESGVSATVAQQFDWLRSLLEWQRSVKSSEEFLDSVKTDLFESEIYVFTPKGEVKEFPEGATVIDFAYAIHTDVGNRCVGAKVNGKMVPIRYVLQNGDTVEILTSPNQKPSKDWLKLAVTNRAKSKIRNFVREEQRQQALLLGRELLEREFKRFGATTSRYINKEDDPVLQKMLSDLGIHRVDDLFIRIGYGRLEPRTVLERLAPDLLKSPHQKDTSEKKGNFIKRLFEGNKIKKSHSLIRVDGMDDMLVHFARCCHPIPGDHIVGFITRGRGITIHRSDCPKAFQFDAERRIDVEWNVDGNKPVARVTKFQVVSQDSPGLLKQIAEAFAANQMNIEGAQIHTTKDGKAISVFTATANSTAQVSQLVQAIQKIKGIIEVKRLIG